MIGEYEGLVCMMRCDSYKDTVLVIIHLIVFSFFVLDWIIDWDIN